MRYMLLIYSTQTDAQTPEHNQQAMEQHYRVMEEATRKGFLLGAEPLAPTSSATTLRSREGGAVITDGPFAETKEQLAGYYLLDCPNLDDAIAVARQIPTGCLGDEGGIEIRPLRVQPGGLEAVRVSGAARA